MATIKEIAEAVGVSNATVSRVLNFDTTISVSSQTREAIFATADRLGYKKKVIYPTIENAAFLYYADQKDELEDELYQNIREEILKQAAETNISMTLYDDRKAMAFLPDDLSGFVAIGWMNRAEIDTLYHKCHNGVFIGTSPDEKWFDSVRPNMDSFITQMVDYLIQKGYKDVGFVGGFDRNIDTGEPSMDIREWSFRQSAIYYDCLCEENIFLVKHYTVEEGYRIGKEIAKNTGHLSALCVASDTLAVGILQAMNEVQVKVPDEMALFSINDSNLAKYVSPPLTTMHIDVDSICETALELIRARILMQSKTTKSIFINGTPIYRKSC